LIGVDDDKSSSGIGEEDIYNGKKEEPMLALLSELYFKLNIISINISSTLLVCLTLSTDHLTTYYCSNQIYI